MSIRELLAQLAISTAETQTQINALAAEVRGLAANVGALHLVLLHPFWHCRVPSKLFENHLKQLCNYHCQMISIQ